MKAKDLTVTLKVNKIMFYKWYNQALIEKWRKQR